MSGTSSSSGVTVASGGTLIISRGGKVYTLSGQTAYGATVSGDLIVRRAPWP